MQVIKPVVFNAASLHSTTATEVYADYNPSTTYSIGNKVVYQTRIYESLINSNTGNTPSTSGTQWLDIGPANKYAMFDTSVSTQTTAASPLTVVVRPGVVFNSIAFIGIEANAMSVSILDAPGGNEIFSETYSLDGSIITDWYSYYFEPFTLLDTVVIQNIPPYSTAEITATFTSAGTIKVGEMISGNIAYIGQTQYGMKYGIKDYSVKDTDDFGNTTLVKRAFSKRIEPQIIVENSRFNYVSKLLSDIRAVPTVWIPTEYTDYNQAVVYGFYRDWDTEITYPTYNLVSLSIEGLT